jgi:hypothetical protein
LKKKTALKEIGIRVKNWRYYNNSIVSLVGRIHYERLALRGSTPEDINKLAAIGHTGYIYPLDEILGISNLPFHATVGAMIKISKEACLAGSYEEAQDRLKESDININDDTIRAITNIVGDIVMNNETKAAKDAYSLFNSGKWKFSVSKIPHTLYLEADGSMVHIRKEKGENEALKKRSKVDHASDKSKLSLEDSNKKSHWREVKLGLAFSTDNIYWWTDKHGDRQHTLQQKDYVSYIGDVSNFKKLMLSLALRNGYGSYRDVVLISDGATWIREMKNMYFPDAQQILDYWHLCENVSEFAKNVFSQDEKKYKPWANKVCELMKESKTLDALSMIKSLTKSQLKKSSFDLAQYIHNNIDNVNYKSYISKGYFIGSGAIESSNRTVVQQRVKLAGMRWSLSSIQKILALMTKLESKRWEHDVVDATYQHFGVAKGKFDFKKNLQPFYIYTRKLGLC